MVVARSRSAARELGTCGPRYRYVPAMRIGLSGGAATVDKMIDQAVRAEADGFSSLWYASAVGGDPLVAMALAGRATTIDRARHVGAPDLHLPSGAAGQPGRLGGRGHGPGRLHPRHRAVARARHRGRLRPVLRPPRAPHRGVRPGADRPAAGEAVDFDGEEFRVHAGGRAATPEPPVPVLVAALAPRLLRVAGELADGTILWMGNARAVETHVAPAHRRRGPVGGRPTPRIVAGLPVAVHDDVDEAREDAAARSSPATGPAAQLPAHPRHRRRRRPGRRGHRRRRGGGRPPEIQALFDAGATDVWAAIFPVGDDRSASRRRTRDLLAGLAGLRPPECPPSTSTASTSTTSAAATGRRLLFLNGSGATLGHHRADHRSVRAPASTSSPTTSAGSVAPSIPPEPVHRWPTTRPTPPRLLDARRLGDVPRVRA